MGLCFPRPALVLLFRCCRLRSQAGGVVDICLAAWNPRPGPAANRRWSGGGFCPDWHYADEEGSHSRSHRQAAADLQLGPGALDPGPSAAWAWLPGPVLIPMRSLPQWQQDSHCSVTCLPVCEMGGDRGPATKGTSSSHRDSGNFALPLSGLFLHTSWGQSFVNQKARAV